MKLRVRLTRHQESPVTVAVVADGTATAGDVATAIASAGLEQPVAPPRPITLQVDGDYIARRILPADVALAESGVTSGTTLTVVEAGEGEARAAVGALLRIVGGPDTGIEVELRVGTSVVGRTSDCQVRLSDPRVSKRHARLTIGRHIEIVDENSANGVVIAGQKVTRATVKPGDTVVLGETLIQVRPVGGVEAAAESQTEVRHLRPPVVQSRPGRTRSSSPRCPNRLARRPSHGWP